MAVGIICEYNPFHAGHLHHIQETRRLTGDPDIICVMSGNYTQRGEPAVADKWVRTRMALAAGADLVLELPTLFSTGAAPDFARGAVALACGTNLIRCLSFGTEPGTEELLSLAADLMTEHAELFSTYLKEALPREISFAKAREAALTRLFSTFGGPDPSPLFQPNAILGLEYLLALRQEASSITPLMIPRQSAGYHNLDPNEALPSAAALRKLLQEHQDIGALLPESVRPGWEQACVKGLAPVFPDAFSASLHRALLNHTPETLRRVVSVDEGLENRILREAASYPSWDVLLQRLSTKRYPTARLRRALLNILLDITEEDRQAAGFPSPAYLRVLGFRREKEELLRSLSRQAFLPVVTSLSQLPELPPEARHSLEAEVRSSDIYFSALPDPAARGRGYEYRCGLVIE